MAERNKSTGIVEIRFLMNSFASALRVISTLQREHANAVGHPPLILRVGAKLALVKSIKNGLIG